MQSGLFHVVSSASRHHQWVVWASRFLVFAALCLTACSSEELVVGQSPGNTSRAFSLTQLEENAIPFRFVDSQSGQVITEQLNVKFTGAARVRNVQGQVVNERDLTVSNGLLTVMCGGDATAFARMQPVAMAYAKAVTRLGDSGAGQLAKMVNQIAIAGLVQGLSEAIAFGEKAGLDMRAVLDVIGKGAAQSWQMDNRGKTMVDGKFDFGFAVDWMRKDLSLVLEEARRNGSQLPVTALVDQFYAEVQGMGGNRWDTSSLIRRL